MKNIYKYLILFAVLIFAADASAQSGGTFEITQSVVSNGGGESTNGNFGVTGTNGQNLAGTNSTGGSFGVRGGFWQGLFAPTAAFVAVSGQVLTAGNQPIGKARVTLTSANGLTRVARTSAFGYFRFDDVEVGQTCILSVQSKRYQFTNGTQVLFIIDEISDIVFISSE